MISLPEFILKDIEDPYVRENFKRLVLFLQKFPFFRGEWAFLEKTITGTVTNLNIAHGLGFKPLDIILTSTTGVGVVTFNYSSFTDTTISVTTTNSCVIRFFAGSYKEESGRTGR